ncbi:MAG TPA: hypothetical protein VJM15_08720 [Sphingomicrobium sp.]|nr:hypothetical protein [Sphingomicrobium sp.]
MRARFAFAALTAIGAGCAPSPPIAPTVVAETAGRFAGPTQPCIGTHSTGSLRVSGGHTLIYDSGATLWVNRPGEGCPGIGSDDILVTEPTGSQLCRGDVVRTLDRLSKVPGPVCVLGDWVPYARPR